MDFVAQETDNVSKLLNVSPIGKRVLNTLIQVSPANLTKVIAVLPIKYPEEVVENSLHQLVDLGLVVRTNENNDTVYIITDRTRLILSKLL
jgi:predicted transcriptional regulator